MAADPGPNAEADASRAPELWKWLVADTFREHLGKAGRRQLEHDRLHDALGDLGLCLRIRSGEQVSFWCPIRPTGLQWLNVGEIRPADGRCLENPTLAALLARKTELTQQEWDNCREADLGARDFVKVKSCYFRPARALPGDANMDAGDIGAAQAIGACRLCGADVAAGVASTGLTSTSLFLLRLGSSSTKSYSTGGPRRSTTFSTAMLGRVCSKVRASAPP